MPGMLLNGVIIWRPIGDPIDNFRASRARRADLLNFVQPHQSAALAFAASIQEPPPKRERLSTASNFRLTHYPALLISYVRRQGLGRNRAIRAARSSSARIVRGCAELGAERETTVDQTLIRGLVTAFRVFVSGLSLSLEDGRRA